MTKAFGERRRAALLRALAETANQTIAAARAKVSRSWVTLHRAEDPGFRAAIEAAVAEAKVALGSGRGERRLAWARDIEGRNRRSIINIKQFCRRPLYSPERTESRQRACRGAPCSRV